MDALFGGNFLEDVLRNQPRAIQEKVEELQENYILNVAEEDLVETFANQFGWVAPKLGEAFIAGDREIQQEKVDRAFNHRYVARLTQLTVCVPYHGDKEFFQMRPPHSRYTVPRANVRSDCLEITLEVEHADGGQVRNSINQFISDVQFYLDQFARIANEYNASLPEIIRSQVQTRKKRILERRSLVSSIGLPLRHRQDIPQTYLVPSVRRKPEVRMPIVSHAPFVPEPVLAEVEYENILRIMRSMVRVMELSPSAFAQMKEEDLRFHFLVQLNGQYEGQATGETFNYNGKTDILIREKERNVFIAECKFWKGADSFSKTIDQVLGYLHWRDTKAAIVVFNQNKDFTNVLDQIVTTAKAHSCFKRLVKQVSDTEWRFVVANADDRNREIQLAVLAFDVPRTKSPSGSR